MNATGGIADKLNVLAARGIVAGISPSGTLRVRPASRLTADEREWLRANTRAILAQLTTTATHTRVTLSGNVRWDQRGALDLMFQADGLVERLGVDGRHPEIVSAAAMVTSAFATRDFETVRFATREFEFVVRTLALAALRQKRIGCLDGSGQDVSTATPGSGVSSVTPVR